MEQYMWKKRVITIVCTETPTLNAGTCTRSRVITYSLDSSRWIHGAIHVEERVVITETATLNTGTCTRNRVITYNLDFSRWIHRAVHVEENDITIRFTETPTLNAGTCTRSRVILTSWIHQGESMEQ